MKLDSNFIAFCKQSIALEQRMAKQAGKRLNEAMRNNIQDINVLDRSAMPSLSKESKKPKLRFLKPTWIFSAR